MNASSRTLPISSFFIIFLCALFGRDVLAADQCSRQIRVPVSNLGWSVVIKGDQFSGILPEFLQQLSQKSQCRFLFSSVPKNRQEILFETAQADLLLPAIRTAPRDKNGRFVPLAQLRPVLISVEGKQAPIQNEKDLLARKDVKLVVVRAFDYGSEYQSIIKKMAHAGRLLQEADVLSVARTMKQDTNYVTIMAATIFYGILEREPFAASLRGRVRYERLDELPWVDSGIYISKLSLSLEDQRYLNEEIERLSSTDFLWKLYLNYYAADILKIGMRPRAGAH